MKLFLYSVIFVSLTSKASRVYKTNSLSEPLSQGAIWFRWSVNVLKCVIMEKEET